MLPGWADGGNAPAYTRGEVGRPGQSFVSPPIPVTVAPIAIQVDFLTPLS
jgi:hypothetical protein